MMRMVRWLKFKASSVSQMRLADIEVSAVVCFSFFLSLKEPEDGSQKR